MLVSYSREFDQGTKSDGRAGSCILFNDCLINIV